MKSGIRLTWEQIRHQNRMFWRNPLAAGFTVAVPLLLLVLFGLIFQEGPGGTDFVQFFTPGIAVFAAVSASFTNLAIGIGVARDQGILKRVRGTPLSPTIYLTGRIGSAVWVAIVSVVVMFVAGVLLYDFEIIWRNTPLAVLVFIVGVGCFAALGLAVVALIGRADAIPAVAQAIILPLAFISGIFIATEDLPAWLGDVALVFPLRHFAELFGRAFDTGLADPVLGWGNLGVLAIWSLAAAAAAVRWFRWDPAGER